MAEAASSFDASLILIVPPDLLFLPFGSTVYVFPGVTKPSLEA
jgi:hypothetical protein